MSDAYIPGAAGRKAIQASIDHIIREAERLRGEYDALGFFGDPDEKSRVALEGALLLEKALHDIFYPPCGVSDKQARDAVARQLPMAITELGTTISWELKAIRHRLELAKKQREELDAKAGNVSI